MKRDTTILILCALFLLADSFCFNEIMNYRQNLEAAFFAVTLICQITAAIFILSLTVFVGKRKFFGREKIKLNLGYAAPANRRFTSLSFLKFVRR